jgi:hypothetical protein
MSLYILAQFVLVLALGVVVLSMGDQGTPLAEVAGPAALVLWSLLNIGGLLEGKPWARPAEFARVLSLPVVALLAFGAETLPLVVASALTAVSVVWLAACRGAQVTQTSPLAENVHLASEVQRPSDQFVRQTN